MAIPDRTDSGPRPLTADEWTRIAGSIRRGSSLAADGELLARIADTVDAERARAEWAESQRDEIARLVRDHDCDDCLDSLRDILGEPISGTPSEDTDTPARATSTLAWTAAPWTPAQVAWLTTMQTSGRVHPLTCGQCRDQLDVEGVLVPGPDGLHCKTCDYVQTSALLPRGDVSEDGDKP